MNIEQKEILNGIFTFIIFIFVIVLVYFIWNEIQAETKDKTEQVADKNVVQSAEENENDSLENAIEENEEVENIEINEEENLDINNNEEPEKQLVIFEGDKVNNLIFVDKYIER